MSYVSYLGEELASQMPLEERVIHLKNKGKIDDIMETLKIDPVVKAMAENYYYSLSKDTIRPEAKLKAVFYCVMAAQETLRLQHQNDDINAMYAVCPAKDLGAELNLNHQQQLSAVKIFQGRLNIENNIIGYVPIKYCIYSKAKNFWDKAVLDDMMCEWERIVTYYPALENYNPDRIVSAFLYYYINRRGYVVDIDELLKQFKDVRREHLIATENIIISIVSSMNN